MNPPIPPVVIPVTLTVALLSVVVVEEAHAGEFDPDALHEAEEEGEFLQTRTCSPGGIHQCDPGEEPLPVQWYHSPVDYRINSLGSQRLHPGESEVTDELKHAVFDSFDAWNEPDCSEMEFHYDGLTERHEPDYDAGAPPEENINILVWHDDEWPHPRYDAIALTSVSYRSATGEILSADIEINTADYPITNTNESSDIRIDFRNALTHEIGHFLGLDHSPNSEATMWRSTDIGETKKRNLHDADIAGLCYIYPDGEMIEQPQTASSSSGGSGDSSGGFGGCSTPADNPAESSLVILLVGLLAIAAGRRSER